MTRYLCPICGKEMDRDLTLFLRHADQHVIDLIMQKHPDWKTKEGVCSKCLEFYAKELGRTAPLRFGPGDQTSP